MKSKYYSWCLSAVLTLLVSIAALPCIAQTLPIQFENLNTRDGLSNQTVFKIIQDRNGFMWFGTQNGLNKFDGYKFTVYKNIPFDTLSLTNNWIQTLLETSDGSIWIGTQNGGVSKFDPNSEIFVNYRNETDNSPSLFNNRIWDIFEDDEKNIWIGASGSLEKFDPKLSMFTHHLVDELNAIPNGAANSIHQDEDGYLWVGTWGSGLYKLNKAGIVLEQFLFNKNGVQTSNKIRVVFESSDNFLWLGTNEDGLIKFTKETGSYTFYSNSPDDPNSISHRFVLSIFEDNSKNLWVGTHSGGLNLFNPSLNNFYRFQYDINDEYSLSNNWVSDIFQAKSGIIWIATDNGICKYIPGRQVFYNLQHKNNDDSTISSNDVHSVCEDSKGIIWIGTWRKGLNKYNPRTKNLKKYFSDPNDKFSLPHNTVFAIYEDKLGNIWIGSYNGLAKYNPTKENFKVYRNDPNNSESIGFNNITSIHQDSFGFLWVGTWDGGLQKMDLRTEKFTRYQKNLNTANGLGDMVINCIYEDQNKNLYIGTSAGGLNIYNRSNDSFTCFLNDPRERSTISNNSVSSICEDREGNIWIGTLGGGLNKFDTNSRSFTNYSASKGFTDNSILSIQPDEFGNFWLSTSGGISFLHASTLNVIEYDHKDGIGNIHFSMASGKGRDGKFIFGGKQGVTYFYPSQSMSTEVNPEILILSVKVLNEKNNVRKDGYGNEYISIDFEDDVFSIDFAIVDFYRPDKIKYSYMLEGFKDEWIQTNKERTAYYTNLDPGEYKFRLRASLINNEWFENKNHLLIIINPPFWHRWWFILISLIIVAALVYTLYRFRTKQLLKMERLRTSIASDLHDEIASNLSGIAMFGKIIQNNNLNNSLVDESEKQLLDRIISLSQESVVAIREIIWAIDPKTETIYNLLIKIKDMIITTCRVNNIKLNFEIPAKELLPAKNLLPNQRRDLWMLMKEALNNSIKHSKCNELSISAVMNSDLLIITIKDNGVGFNPNSAFEGKGLSTMKKRAVNLNAELEFVTGLNSGTTIILSLGI